MQWQIFPELKIIKNITQSKSHELRKYSFCRHMHVYAQNKKQIKAPYLFITQAI